MADGDQDQYIKLPDGSYGKFPASMKDEEITAVVSKQFPATPPAAAAAPKESTWEKVKRWTGLDEGALFGGSGEAAGVGGSARTVGEAASPLFMAAGEGVGQAIASEARPLLNAGARRLGQLYEPIKRFAAKELPGTSPAPAVIRRIAARELPAAAEELPLPKTAPQPPAQAPGTIPPIAAEVPKPRPTAESQLDEVANRLFGKPYGSLANEEQVIVARNIGGPDIEQRTLPGVAPTAERRAGAMPIPSKAPPQAARPSADMSTLGGTTKASPGAPVQAPGPSGTLPRIGPPAAPPPMTLGGGVVEAPPTTLPQAVDRAMGVKPPEPAPPDPLKAEFPDPAVRRLARANGPELLRAAGDRMDVVQAVHDLSNVEVRQAAINAGIDVGQKHVGSRIGLGSEQVTRQDLIDQMIKNGVKPEEIPGLAQPKTNPIALKDLKEGDTFVDEKGDPRRITEITKDGKIKTADGTLRNYQDQITAQGELNSPKAQLARGGRFHPAEEPEELPKESPEDFERRRKANLEGLGIRLDQMAPKDLANWVGHRPDDTIIVYRGTEGHPMQPGDYVTTSREAAEQYGKKIESREVSGRDLRYVRGHKDGDPSRLDMGGQVELVYAPRSAEVLPNLPAHLAKHLEPDEIEFLRGRNLLQKNVAKAYQELPSISEMTNVARAGHGLGGWWQRFMDTFKALGAPTEEMKQLGPSHVEALKALHGAVSGNKAVEQANVIAWGVYRDWLQADRPTDLDSINRIVRANGGVSGRGGLDTQKVFKLVNSPQFQEGAAPTGEAFLRSPVEGTSPGAKKIPSMVATTAGQGNLKRIVFDTHMKDLYGINNLSDSQYLAASIHIRQVGEALGYAGGEAQEQMWGTVLGLKQLLGKGLSPRQAAAAYGKDVLASVGKDYAQVIQDSMADPEVREIMEDLKKYGFDPGGPVASKQLEQIVAEGARRMSERARPISRGLLEKTARRIASSRAGP